VADRLEVALGERRVVEHQQRRSLQGRQRSVEQAGAWVGAAVQAESEAPRPGVVRVLQELLERPHAARVLLKDVAQPRGQVLALEELAVRRVCDRHSL
jgi:hypothetical protein